MRFAIFWRLVFTGDLFAGKAEFWDDDATAIGPESSGGSWTINAIGIGDNKVAYWAESWVGFANMNDGKSVDDAAAHGPEVWDGPRTVNGDDVDAHGPEVWDGPRTINGDNVEFCDGFPIVCDGGTVNG